MPSKRKNNSKKRKSAQINLNVDNKQTDLTVNMAEVGTHDKNVDTETGSNSEEAVKLCFNTSDEVKEDSVASLPDVAVSNDNRSPDNKESLHLPAVGLNEGAEEETRTRVYVSDLHQNRWSRSYLREISIYDERIESFQRLSHILVEAQNAIRHLLIEEKLASMNEFGTNGQSFKPNDENEATSKDEVFEKTQESDFSHEVPRKETKKDKDPVENKELRKNSKESLNDDRTEQEADVSNSVSSNFDQESTFRNELSTENTTEENGSQSYRGSNFEHDTYFQNSELSFPENTGVKVENQNLQKGTPEGSSCQNRDNIELTFSAHTDGEKIIYLPEQENWGYSDDSGNQDNVCHLQEQTTEQKAFIPNVDDREITLPENANNKEESQHLLGHKRENDLYIQNIDDRELSPPGNINDEENYLPESHFENIDEAVENLNLPQAQQKLSFENADDRTSFSDQMHVQLRNERKSLNFGSNRSRNKKRTTQSWSSHYIAYLLGEYIFH